jgi:PHD/YefM family antitoxin component YafN of YafNO toxin-antitoxin module
MATMIKQQKFSRSDITDLMERAIAENGSVIIRRPGHADLAIIAADKLRDLDTTDYLFASPRNRRRLQVALRDAKTGKGRTMSVQALRQQVGLD